MTTHAIWTIARGIAIELEMNVYEQGGRNYGTVLVKDIRGRGIKVDGIHSDLWWEIHQTIREWWAGDELMRNFNGWFWPDM